MSPINTRSALEHIISLVSDPNTVSDVPLYVREALKEGFSKIMADNLSSEELAEKLIGALRVIGDSRTTTDEDVIPNSILQLYDTLTTSPPESSK